MAYFENRFLWGYQALASSQEPIRGVKLLLDEEQSYRYSPSLRAKKMLGVLKKSPVDVSAEYLKKVLEHIHQNLERRFGPAVNNMSKKYVLTVPAVWSDKAKDATMKVAIGAGLPQNQLSLLSEPEAAALYTLRAIQPNTIKVCTCQHVRQHNAVVNNNSMTERRYIHRLRRRRWNSGMISFMALDVENESSLTHRTGPDLLSRPQPQSAQLGRGS